MFTCLKSLKGKHVYSMLSTILIVILFVYIGIISFLPTGCEVMVTHDSVTLPLISNSTLVANSRTQSEGILIAAYKLSESKFIPIADLDSSNIDTKMSWTTNDNITGEITGNVILTPLNLLGKSVASAIDMDYSGSMDTTERKQMQNAVNIFIDKMSSTDIAQIIKFNDVIRIKTPFTSNKQLLKDSVNSQYDLYNFEGWTALYQSIYTATNNVYSQNPVNYIRNVIALSDGGNNRGIPKEQCLLNALTKGIPIYTIGFGVHDPDNNCFNHYNPPDSSLNQCEWHLWDIATKTGGFYFYSPKTASDINDVYNSISGALGNSYTIVINWPGGGLPPTGTQVTVTINVIYQGQSYLIIRNYALP